MCSVLQPTSCQPSICAYLSMSCYASSKSCIDQHRWLVDANNFVAHISLRCFTAISCKINMKISSTLLK